MENRRRTRSPASDSGAISDISADIQIQFSETSRNYSYGKEHPFNPKRSATIHYGDKSNVQGFLTKSFSLISYWIDSNLLNDFL